MHRNNSNIFHQRTCERHAVSLRALQQQPEAHPNKDKAKSNMQHAQQINTPASGTPYRSAHSSTCCSSPCGLQRPSGGCSQSRISTQVKLSRPLNSAMTCTQNQVLFERLHQQS
jgi:F420-0:gamma-glutamyl ligase